MATFVLIPGAGSDSWYWHLIAPRLAAAGHEVVAVDLPCEDDSAGLSEYTDAVVEAVGDRPDVVLVAQSMGGFTAPLVCDRLPVELIVLVAAMVPVPGESPGEWWANTGHDEAMRAAAASDGRPMGEELDPVELFLHDLPPDLAEQVMAHDLQQSGTPFDRAWPRGSWPRVPTRFLLCRQDRLFPADFMRRLASERLGLDADEMDGGHLPALARPAELTERLLRYHADLA